MARYFVGIVSAGLLLLAAATKANGPASPLGACDWRVQTRRPATSADRPFVSTHRLLRELDDARVAPGPGSLQAVVKSDAQHHPHIFLEDSATGSSRPLLERSLSQPRWSPDGKWIACTTWESRQRPWLLCVVDVASRRTLRPEFGALVSRFRWAPDSRTLAVAGVLYGRPTCVLVLVSIPSGQVRVVDTLSIHADYDFSWSPDSRLLVVSKPTSVNQYEEVAAADLWLFDRRGGKCRLTDTPEAEREPHWIAPTRLLFEVPSGNGEDASWQKVIELVPKRGTKAGRAS